MTANIIKITNLPKIDIESERKNELDELAKIIRGQGINEITIDMLPKYTENLSFSNNYTVNEIKYFYMNLLKKYIDDLIVEQKEIRKSHGKEDYNILVEIHKETLKNCFLIKKLMEAELAKYYEDCKKEEKNGNDINKLFYYAKPSGKSYLEDDIKSLFPEDSYNAVINLLIRFKNGYLMPSQRKNLISANALTRGYSEIRDDQIRIIYKRLKDNEYAIVGAFIKKADNNLLTYQTICERNQRLLISDEEFEKNFFEQLTQNAHRGGRRA